MRRDIRKTIKNDRTSAKNRPCYLVAALRHAKADLLVLDRELRSEKASRGSRDQKRVLHLELHQKAVSSSLAAGYNKCTQEKEPWTSISRGRSSARRVDCDGKRKTASVDCKDEAYKQAC